MKELIHQKNVGEGITEKGEGLFILRASKEL